MKNRESEIDDTIVFAALEAIYFDTLTPIAQKMRDAGIDLLQVNWQSEADSYWEPCEDYAEMTVQR
jgi:hypothetical protein